MAARLKMLFVSIFVILILSAANAKSIYVDPKNGSDLAAGNKKAPFSTIKKAIDVTAPGDTVHLSPVIYHESITFNAEKSGTSEKPIVVDGHGAIIDGASPLDIRTWEKVGNGLYKNTQLQLIKGFDIIRWAFFFNDQINRMGRTSKGVKAVFKTPEALGLNEWTYDEHEKAFYIRTDPSKSLAEINIKAPVLTNGVAFSASRYIVVKNITTRRVINDGFNIHGDCFGLYFENIRAEHCGDDGFSAHENSMTRVNGFTSIDNSTGVCSINNSCSEMSNVIIKDCVAWDIFFPQGGTNIVHNCVVLSSSQNGICAGAQPDQNFYSSLVLDNFLFIRSGKPVDIRVNRGARLKVNAATLSGANIIDDGDATITNTSAGGAADLKLKIASNATWKADHNNYYFDSIELNGRLFKPEDFESYRQTGNQDSHSIWLPAAQFKNNPGDKAGADLSSLPKY